MPRLQVPVPIHMQQFGKKADNATAHLALELGRAPSSRELASFLNCSEKTVARAAAAQISRTYRRPRGKFAFVGPRFAVSLTSCTTPRT